MFGGYSVDRYHGIEYRIDEIEAELDELRKLKFAMDDEDEAEEIYGEDIADLEAELNDLQGELGAIELEDMTREYWAMVL